MKSLTGGLEKERDKSLDDFESGTYVGNGKEWSWKW